MHDTLKPSRSNQLSSPGNFSDEQDPQIRAKLVELHGRTICYNQELSRIARELADLRAERKARAAE